MAKQTINIGSTANDGTGSTLRVGGDIINDNFNEIYTAFGDGSTLTAPLTAAGTATLTNKTIDLGGTGNVITGSLAEFNTALQGDSFVSLTGSETLTNKTLTTPTITSGVFNTGVSGSAVLDEDDLSSNSATKAATQQSIKAYIDNQLTAQDLDIAPDSGTGQSIDLNSETLTFSGGSNIGSSATSNTVTFAISDVVQLTATQTLTNKTFTSPTISAFTLTSGTNSGLNVGSGGIIFEGATADAHETTLQAEDPTADATITIPNDSITCITTATHATQAVHIARAIALG